MSKEASSLWNNYLIMTKYIVKSDLKTVMAEKMITGFDDEIKAAILSIIFHFLSFGRRFAEIKSWMMAI